MLIFWVLSIGTYFWMKIERKETKINDYQIVLEYTEEERRKKKVPDRKWRLAEEG